MPRRDGNWCHDRANMLKQDGYSNADDTIYLLHPVDYVKMYAVHKFYVGDEHAFTLFWFHAIQSIKTLRTCFRTVCKFQPNPDGICIIQFLKITRLSNTIRWLLTSNVAVIPGSLGKLHGPAFWYSISPLLGYGPGGPVPVPVPESENLCCYADSHDADAPGKSNMKPKDFLLRNLLKQGLISGSMMLLFPKVVSLRWCYSNGQILMIGPPGGVQVTQKHRYFRKTEESFTKNVSS